MPQFKQSLHETSISRQKLSATTRAWMNVYFSFLLYANRSLSGQPHLIHCHQNWLFEAHRNTTCLLWACGQMPLTLSHRMLCIPYQERTFHREHCRDLLHWHDWIFGLEMCGLGQLSPTRSVTCGWLELTQCSYVWTFLSFSFHLWVCCPSQQYVLNQKLM